MGVFRFRGGNVFVNISSAIKIDMEIVCLCVGWRRSTAVTVRHLRFSTRRPDSDDKSDNYYLEILFNLSLGTIDNGLITQQSEGTI